VRQDASITDRTDVTAAGATATRSVLMIAFHFPPLSLSSGYLRPLKFAEYLPEHHWRAEILTVDPRAHAPESCLLNGPLKNHLRVHRAFALDTRRHLSLFGRYPWSLAVPDRWWTWWLPAVLRGLRVVRQRRPAALLSTYPIPTAHLIGWTLHRITGIPWIAEFRDPMTDDIYHRNCVVRTANRWIERVTLERCAAAVFVTPSARIDYARRYPQVSPSKLVVIPNGYDHEAFAGLGSGRPAVPSPDRPLLLVHSGLLYPEERDPRPFLAALRTLKASGDVTERSLRVVLRGSGHDDYYGRLIAEHGLADVVRLAPPVSYRDAIREMTAADGLLLFQAASLNLQIPAKAYEYLGARRPIFALTDPAGDTAAMLTAAGVGCIARLDSEEDICTKLRPFLEALRCGNAPVAKELEIARQSRRARTAALADLLDTVVASCAAVKA